MNGKKPVDLYFISLLYSVISKGDIMKSKQIKHGAWKDAVVFFNGFIAKVVDFDGVDKFKISIHKDWIHKDLIVWS